MLISQLPPGLKELAELRRSQCDDPPTTRQWGKKGSSDDLSFAFWWSETPEGGDFWDDVDTGKYPVYYGCRVVNFKLKEQIPHPHVFDSPSTVIDRLKRQNYDNDYHL